MENLARKLLVALVAGMDVVKRAQLSKRSESEVKSTDATLVTETDRKSGLAMKQVLQTIPGLKLHGEDTETEVREGNQLCWFDPLDGTRAFANGLTTSTVIIAIYDESRRRLTHVLVGEPATGRIWEAEEGKETKLHYFPCFPNLDEEYSRFVHVWQGPVLLQSSVFIDVTHGFNRGSRQLFTDTDIAKLFGLFNGEVKLFFPGSNGLIQALVANGGDRVAGSITTAQGGPWDVCGGLLVMQAGGAARAFRLEERKLIEGNPLDPLSFDILVTGNSKATVDYLVGKLECVLK